MDDPDANVIYIHTPKANDMAAWMLQAMVLIFFCLGAVFIFALHEVGKALESNKEPETTEPEDDRNQVIMIHGNIPKGGRGQVELLYANGAIMNYTFTPPRLYSTGLGPDPTIFSLRSQKSIYYGLPSGDPSSHDDFDLLPTQYGVPSAFKLPHRADNAKTKDITLPARDPVRDNDNKHLISGTRRQQRCADTSTGQGRYWNWRAPSASPKVYNTPAVAETPVAVLYQGMPRHRPSWSSAAARPSTYSLTPPAAQKKIETLSNQLPPAVKHQNLSDWSDIMENMNAGGAGTPFAEYYRYSGRP